MYLASHAGVSSAKRVLDGDNGRRIQGDVAQKILRSFALNVRLKVSKKVDRLIYAQLMPRFICKTSD